MKTISVTGRETPWGPDPLQHGKDWLTCLPLKFTSPLALCLWFSMNFYMATGAGGRKLEPP